MSRRTAVLALWGAVVLALALPALVDAGAALVDGVRYAGEDLLSARRRFFPEYADGIAAIDRALPRDARYLLAEGGSTAGYVFVQFDLAPRRAVHLGRWYVTLDELKKSGPPPGAPEWTVVSLGLRRPPVLARTADLFARR